MSRLPFWDLADYSFPLIGGLLIISRSVLGAPWCTSAIRIGLWINLFMCPLRMSWSLPGRSLPPGLSSRALERRRNEFTGVSDLMLVELRQFAELNPDAHVSSNQKNSLVHPGVLGSGAKTTRKVFAGRAGKVISPQGPDGIPALEEPAK